VPSYVENVTAMVERAGGRYLARTNRIEILEGDRPRGVTILILEWPSKETADAFYESEEYRPFREARQLGARNTLMLVPGEDVTKASRLGKEGRRRPNH
jgi:uncharacterized protein (DUF1330 family)